MAKESSSNGLEKRPKLRFPGFDGAWSNVELGSKLIPYSEITTENNQYPPLTSSRKGLFLQTDYFNRQVASEDNTGYNIVPYGYFTYRHMSDDRTFYFNINEIVEKGIVSTLYPVFTTTDGLNSHFLRAYLNYSKRFALYCVLQKQGGSRTYMYFRKLCAHNAVIPSVEEQEKIADFIDLLDKRIKLQNEKIECLKKYKRGAIDGLLSRKLHFQTTSSWREVKISELFSPISEKGYVNLTVLTIVQGVGTQPRESVERRISYDKSNTNTYKRVLENDFILHLRSFEGGLEIANSEGIVSPAYTILRTKEQIIPLFYYVYFRSYWFISNKLRIAVEGIRDGKSINMETFWNIVVPYPPIEEQKHIAEYLLCLDTKLKKAEAILDRLKAIKKGFSQQLFI